MNWQLRSSGMVAGCCLLLLATAPQFVGGEEQVDRKRVLLIGQKPDGHPPATHEYRAGMELLAECLAPRKELRVQVVSADGDWLAGAELVRQAHCVVLFVSEGGKWLHARPRRLQAFAQHAAGGGGLVAPHWGMGAREARYIDGYVKLFGGCHGGPDRKYKVVDTQVTVAQPNHPVTRGIDDFRVHEEFYYRLKFVKARPSFRPLLTARIDGRNEPVAWAWQRDDGGRSCGFSGGHFHENWRRVEYRRLMAQAVLWTLRIDPPRHGLEVELAEAAYDLPPR